MLRVRVCGICQPLNNKLHLSIEPQKSIERGWPTDDIVLDASASVALAQFPSIYE